MKLRVYFNGIYYAAGRVFNSIATNIVRRFIGYLNHHPGAVGEAIRPADHRCIVMPVRQPGRVILYSSPTQKTFRSSLETKEKTHGPILQKAFAGGLLQR